MPGTTQLVAVSLLHSGNDTLLLLDDVEEVEDEVSVIIGKSESTAVSAAGLPMYSYDEPAFSADATVDMSEADSTSWLVTESVVNGVLVTTETVKREPVVSVETVVAAAVSAVRAMSTRAAKHMRSCASPSQMALKEA